MILGDKDVPQEQTANCPKCGGRLVFRSDSMGYGMTIESCENFSLHPVRRGVVTGCDHWRTLERPVRPELAREAFGRRPTRQGAWRTEALRQRVVRVLQLLPDTRVGAWTAHELAKHLRLHKHVASYTLREMERAGLLESGYRPRTGKTGRPYREYWRAA